VAFEAGDLTFSSGYVRRQKAVLCTVVAGLGALLLVQMASKDPGSVVVVYMCIVALVVVVAIVGIVRAFRIGIEVTDEGVTAKTTYSTKHFAWDEIAEAQSVDRAIATTGRGLVPMSPQARQRIQVVLVLRLTSGQRRRLQGLQVKIESDTYSNWLDDAVREINERLEERRGALGSGATPPRPS
jgi:hypothetical protein